MGVRLEQHDPIDVVGPGPTTHHQFIAFSCREIVNCRIFGVVFIQGLRPLIPVAFAGTKELGIVLQPIERG